MVLCKTENCVWLCKCTKLTLANSALFPAKVCLEIPLGSAAVCRFLISSEADFKLTCSIPKEPILPEFISLNRKK